VAVTYFGGKKRLAKKIAEIIQSGPKFRTYVEPFAGGASVLFALPAAPVEVINDLNSDLVNFWRVMRDDGLELQRMLTNMPFSREEHNFYRQADRTGMSAMERAISWYVRTQFSFSHMEDGTFGVSVTSSQPRTHAYRIDQFHKTVDRLRMVMLENQDWEKVVARYDRPGTVFYMDPPYPGTSQSYKHQFDWADFERLVRACEQLKGRAVLSCYEANTTSLSDWTIHRFPRKCSVGNVGTERIECVCVHG